jgi:hypothetical protein
VASNIAVLPLLLRRSIRRPPFSGRPRRQCGIPALPLALLPMAAHLRPTAPPIPPATSARVYRAATDTPLGQKNHQKWCLSPGSVDLCNLSLFRCCTRTTLLTKRQIRRSESRSEEITAVQASTRPQKDLPFANALHALPRASMVIHALPRALEPICPLPTRFTRPHAPPWSSTRFHAPGRSFHAPAISGSTSHALWNILAREIHAPYQSLVFHAPTRLLAREMHVLAATGFAREPHAPGALPRVPRAYWRVRCTRFLQPQALRVHNTRQAFSHATRLLAREMHAPFSQQLWRVLHAPGVPHHFLLPRVSQRTATSALALPRVKLHKKKKKEDPDPIFSARSNGLEPDLLKWVRPSIGPRVSVF